MWITTADGLPITTEGGAAIVTETPPPSPPLPLQAILPSYLYWQYADDDDLQAFVNAYNALAQGYLDWFNQTPLSVYTSPAISGQLLDWIGQGIYGIARPVFSSLTSHFYAGLNALPLNVLAVNGSFKTSSGTAVTASDDFYKRALTWALYAGNGRHFSLSVLRQRVARWLYGINGTDVTLSQAQTVHLLAGPVALPPRPVLSQVAGGSSPVNRSYVVQNTYVTPLGEGLPGPAATFTVGPGYVLDVQSPPASTGADGWNTYVGPATVLPAIFQAGLNANPLNATPVDGSNVPPPTLPPTKQNTTPIAIGTPWIEPTSGLITGAKLPAVDTSNPLTNIIIEVPAAAGPAAQFFQQAFEQGLLAFPAQLTADVVIY